MSTYTDDGRPIVPDSGEEGVEGGSRVPEQDPDLTHKISGGGLREEINRSSADER